MKFVVKVRSTGSGSIQPLVRGVAKWINSLFLNLTPTSIPNVRRLVSFWSLVWCALLEGKSPDRNLVGGYQRNCCRTGGELTGGRSPQTGGKFNDGVE